MNCRLQNPVAEAIAISRDHDEDERALSPDEHELVGKSRHPTLETLDDPTLSALMDGLRGCLDGEPDIDAESETTGPGGRRALLGAALERVQREKTRREAGSAHSALVANAEKALAMKQEGQDKQPQRPASRTAGQGMQPNQRADAPPSGAFAQEGQRPVLERSRKVR